MTRSLALAAALLLAACGDPADPPPAATADGAADSSAVAAEAGAPDCLAVASDFAADRYGGAVEPVAEHTVPFDDGCFLTFYREVTAPMLAPGEDFPYPYSFTVVRGEAVEDVDLGDADLPALTLAAVGFGDADDDGDRDVFVVHQEGRGFALLDDGGTWTVDEPSGVVVSTVAQLRDHYARGGAPAAASGALADVTVRNGTGMTLVFLFAAGCTESEGNDWSAMDEWATDYLGDEVLEADGAVTIELVPGCYVFNPVWDDDTSLQERVEVDGDTKVDLTLG